MPHTLYKPCPEALDTMLAIYANDAKDLATQGINIMEDGSCRRLHFWILGIKGDLPYLGRSGHFLRSFSMCPKKSVSQLRSHGICWQCSAGDERLEEKMPWEDFRSTAKWLGSIGADPGYGMSSPLLNIPHDNGHALYRGDLWHIFHLGCGKNFAASSIVVLLESMEGPSVDWKLQQLTTDFRMFCKQHKYYMYISAITKELLGFEKGSDPAMGHWSKGFITTRLLQWLDDVLPRKWPNPTVELQRVIVFRSSIMSNRFYMYFVGSNITLHMAVNTHRKSFSKNKLGAYPRFRQRSVPTCAFRDCTRVEHGCLQARRCGWRALGIVSCCFTPKRQRSRLSLASAVTH